MEAFREPEGSAVNGWQDIAAVLLVIQAGIGLVAAMGSVVFGAAGHDLPAMTVAILVALVVPVIMIWLAGGLNRAQRWARLGTVMLELIVLAGASLRLLIGKDLAFDLLPVLTGVILPLTVIAAICRGRERRS